MLACSSKGVLGLVEKVGHISVPTTQRKKKTEKRGRQAEFPVVLAKEVISYTPPILRPEHFSAGNNIRTYAGESMHTPDGRNSSGI